MPTDTIVRQRRNVGSERGGQDLVSRFCESISTFILLKSLPANYERSLIQLFLDLLGDGERCGLRVSHRRHMYIELVTSGLA
jgi:hypothetical protein